MATTQWQRTRQPGRAWTNAQISELVSFGNPAGRTILRVRFAWGFNGMTSSLVSPTSVMANAVTFGLVTTVGNGSETVPHPVSASGDQAPPTQRWLYWSVRVPRVCNYDAPGETVAWTSTTPEEEGSTKGQVLAPSTMGTGNTLNLWATWVPVAAWDVTGLAMVWWAASVLVRVPLCRS